MDQRARGLFFPLNLHALGVKHVANVCSLVAARWRLDLLNNHPAKCKRPLKGADIGARKVAISWDIAVG